MEISLNGLVHVGTKTLMGSARDPNTCTLSTWTVVSIHLLPDNLSDVPCGHANWCWHMGRILQNQVMESFVDYRSPGKCDTISEKKKKEQDLRSSKKTTQNSHRSMHIAAFPVPSLHSPQGDISSQTSGVESLAVQEVLLSAQSSARCRRVADVLYPPPLLLET